MSIMGNVDGEKLNKLKEPVDFVLSCDLEELRRMDERTRTETWNTIKSNKGAVDKEFLPKLGRKSELAMKIKGDFTLAMLLLATAAWKNGEENPMIEIEGFTDREFKLVEDFEKFNMYDNFKGVL